MIISNTRRLSKAAPYPFVGTASAGAYGVPAGVLRNEERDLAPLALNPINQRLGMLRQLAQGWDGYGSARPNSAAINRAQAILPEFFRGAALTELGWSNPHVSANESGDVVLEWWRDALKMTVYVNAVGTSFVRVWGEDVETEMDEGTLPDARYDFARIWSWLNT